MQLLEPPFRQDSFTRLLRYEIKGNLWLLAFHRFKISDQKKLVSPFLLATSIVCICYLICVKTMEHMLSPGGKEEPGRATAHSFIHAHALLLLLVFFRQNNAGNFLNRNLSFWCNDTLLYIYFFFQYIFKYYVIIFPLLGAFFHFAPFQCKNYLVQKKNVLPYESSTTLFLI